MCGKLVKNFVSDVNHRNTIPVSAQLDIDAIFEDSNENYDKLVNQYNNTAKKLVCAFALKAYKPYDLSKFAVKGEESYHRDNVSPIETLKRVVAAERERGNKVIAKDIDICRGIIKAYKLQQLYIETVYEIKDVFERGNNLGDTKLTDPGVREEIAKRAELSKSFEYSKTIREMSRDYTRGRLKI